jgi:hypothetical protein
MRGDSLLGSDVHPTSQEFFDLCDSLKEMHRRKSRDYGCPSGEDPLANIRNNLFDLASYSLLALLLHREEQGK